jgi:thiol-disulfide isomerase/thioredoxin
VLKPAWSVPVRVHDMDGQPVEGAWVTSQHGDRFGHRTNRDGSCTVRNLPAGTARIGVSYGDQAGSAQVEVTPAAAAGAGIVIQLKKGISNPNAILSANAARPRLAPLPIGAAAPEWSIAEWTDGKQHALADLRGKIVVIEFWDYGCKPCREITLPVSNILQAKYKDVAFVHINPAGSKQHLIKELLALESWSFVVGFDKGMRETDGETLKAYGVNGFSTIVILDRLGRVLENSAIHLSKDQEEARSKAIAVATGLPWPIDKDASQEEVIRRFRRFHEHLMTTLIEQALATK